jgi:apolipoprotein N-acyltransferase
MFKRLQTIRGWRADLAALLLGGLSAAALPPLHVIPVLLLAVPGLLALIGATPGTRAAARRGWWFGFGLNVLGLYWVTEAILVEAARFWWLVPFAVPALAAVLAVFVAAPAALARRADTGWRRAVVLAAAWTLSDIARQFILTGFPWNPWGSVWAIPGMAGDIFIQPAAFVGVHGLTLATLLLAATGTGSWRGRLMCVVALLAWAGFGALRLAGPPPVESDLTAVLVQGNVPQGQKWNQNLALSIFRRYLRLTHDGVATTHGPVVVVWPETAYPFLLDRDAPQRAAITQATDGATALIGSVRLDDHDRPRNALFAIQAGGAVTGVYDKWHLVPFGEYQPDWFPLPIQVVPGGGFAPGPGPRTLHLPGLPPVGPLICYEAIFGAELVDPADRPSWLVNITNDAWFGNSAGPRQHLAAARMRAVEEGLPLLRAANTGISAGFDAYGHEMARLGLGQTGTLEVPIPGELPPTVFARIGLWMPGALASTLLALGLLWRAPRHAEDELETN